MTIPNELAEWTFETVRDLVAQGVFENDRFDFKEMLPDSRNEKDKQHLRKTVAAFANTDGGFLVFGVKDGRVPPTEERIVGLDKGYELPRDFGNYPGTCEPSVEWEPLNPPLAIPETKKVIHIVRIRPSWRKPHAVLEGVQFIFPKRTNKGNEDMSYTEVRQAFQENEFRRSKLALLISELENMKTVSEEIKKKVPTYSNKSSDPHLLSWTTRFDTTILDVILGDVFSFFGADPRIWKEMSDIRRAAVVANSACEAFSSIVYQRDSEERADATRKHYSLMHDSAQSISDRVTIVQEYIRKLLA